MTEIINRFQRGGKIKSQRLINVLLEAKRENPNITKKELYYVAMGYKASAK